MLDFLKSQKFLKSLVFLGLLGLIVFIFSQKINLTASDLGRHLTNGRAVWSNPEVLFHNAYSYTEPDFPFVNHHWLYGVIVYGVYRLAGFVGLSILNILLILAAFSLAFFIARRKISAAGTDLFGQAKVDGFYFATLLSLPVILLLSERVEVRPEIFSYLFIILTYALLESVERTKKYRRLWLLAPLFALWANIHIYFFIGLALVGFKTAAIFSAALIEKKEGLFKFFHKNNFLSAWRAARFWLLIFGASVLACLLNPNTWRGLAYPFNIFQNYGYEIAENKSIFFLENLMVDHNFFLFKFILVLLIISWALHLIFARPLRARFQELIYNLLISLFITGLALFSSRNISLFGLMSLIIISASMAPVLVRFKEHNEKRLNLWQRFVASPFSRRHSYVLLVFLAAIIVIFFYLLNDYRNDNYITKNPFGLGLTENNEASAAFFKEKNLSGPIFNNYDIGSALIFWLYGREKVFVDNRPEAYSIAFFNDIYKPMQLDAAKWEEYSRKYDFKTIYFTHTDGTSWAQQFLNRILKDQKWRLVYFDADTVILIDSEKYSAAAVKALSLDKWTFKSRLRALSANAPLKTKLHLANLAQLAGLPELAEEVYREILLSAPDQAQTLYSLAGLYSSYNDQTNLVKSLDYYQRALDAGLRLPGVYDDMALAYWNLGEYKKAESAWHSALKRERKNTNALYYLDQVNSLRRAGKLPAE